MANLSDLSYDTRVALEKARQRIREKFNYELPITSGFRSFEEQSALYSKRGSNPYPVAKPGTSRHEKGNALDISVKSIPKKLQGDVLSILAEEGLTRPHANDPVHFEYVGRVTAKGGSLADAFGGQTASLSEAFGGQPTAKPSSLSEAFGGEQATRPTTGPRIGAPYQSALSDRALAPLFNPDLTRPLEQGRRTTDVLRAEPTLGNLFHGGIIQPGRAFTAGVNELLDIRRRMVETPESFRGRPIMSDIRQVGSAIAEGYQDIDRQTTPDYFRTKFQLEPGIAPRWAYNTAAVADYVTDFFLNPVDILTGKGIGRVAAPAVAAIGRAAGPVTARVGEWTQTAGRLAEQGMGKLVGEYRASQFFDQTAKLQTGTNRMLEAFGIGPNMRIRREIREKLYPELEEQFGKVERIVTAVDRDFARLADESPEFATAAREYYENQRKTFREAPVADIKDLRFKGPSPFDEAIRRYVFAHGIGEGGQIIAPAQKALDNIVKFSNNYSLDPFMVFEHGDDLLKVMSETVTRLRALKVPTANVPFSKGQKEFMNEFFYQAFGRGGAERLGEVGSARIAGTGVEAIRRAGLRGFANQIAKDLDFARSISDTSPMTRGWVKVPKDTFHTEFGNLQGMQVPEPVYRLLRYEGNLANKHVNAMLRSVGITTEEGSIPLLTALNWIPRLIVQPIKVGKLTNFLTPLFNFSGGMGTSLMAATREGLEHRRILDFGSFKKAFDDIVSFKKGLRAAPDIEEVPNLRFNRISTSFLATGKTRGEQIEKVLYGVRTRDKVKKVTESFAEFQGTIEMAQRLHLYRAAREAGKDLKEAGRIVNKYMFDYSDRSDALELLDRYGLWIFNTYPTKAFKLLLQTLVENPGQIAYYPRLQQMLTTEFDSAGELEKLPEWERGLFTLPVEQSKFANLQRFHPLSDSVDTLRTLVGSAIKRELPPGFLRDIAAKPLIVPFVAALAFNFKMTGDPDKPRTISHPGAPLAQRIPDHLRELSKQILPPIVGGRHFFNTIEAGFGITGSDYRWTEAKPFPKALLEYTLGIRLVDAESFPQRAQRLAPVINERANAAAKYAAEWLNAAQEAKSENNPYYHGIQDMSAEELNRQVKDTGRYFGDLLLSGRSVNSKGELTDEGKREIANTAFYLYAQVKRLKDLTAPSPQMPLPR